MEERCLTGFNILRHDDVIMTYQLVKRQYGCMGVLRVSFSRIVCVCFVDGFLGYRYSQHGA